MKIANVVLNILTVLTSIATLTLSIISLVHKRR